MNLQERWQVGRPSVLATAVSEPSAHDLDDAGKGSNTASSLSNESPDNPACVTPVSVPSVAADSNSHSRLCQCLGRCGNKGCEKVVNARLSSPPRRHSKMGISEMGLLALRQQVENYESELHCIPMNLGDSSVNKRIANPNCTASFPMELDDSGVNRRLPGPQTPPGLVGGGWGVHEAWRPRGVLEA